MLGGETQTECVHCELCRGPALEVVRSRYNILSELSLSAFPFLLSSPNAFQI